MNVSAGGGQDYSKYLLHGRAEIIQVLGLVAQHREMVSAHFGTGRQFLLTSILEAGEDGIYLDTARDATQMARLLAAPKVVFVTSLDRVKVQFATSSVQERNFQGAPALHCPLPDVLLKLQRREFFRVSTPMAHPLKLHLTMPDGRHAGLTVVDISLGGLGLMGGITAELVPGSVFQDCHLDLDTPQELRCDLEVRNSFEVKLRTGRVARRAGCAFVDLPGSEQARLQRFILRLERNRIARTGSE